MIDVIASFDTRSFRPWSSKLTQINLVSNVVTCASNPIFLKCFLRKTGVDQWIGCLEPVLLQFNLSMIVVKSDVLQRWL